jgi:hypothetical protein
MFQNNTKSSLGQHQVVLKGNARLPLKGFARQHQMTPENNSLLPPRNYFEFTQRQALLTPSHVPATLQPNKMRSGVKPQLTMVSFLCHHDVPPRWSYHGVCFGQGEFSQRGMLFTSNLWRWTSLLTFLDILLDTKPMFTML